MQPVDRRGVFQRRQEARRRGRHLLSPLVVHAAEEDMSGRLAVFLLLHDVGHRAASAHFSDAAFGLLGSFEPFSIALVVDVEVVQPKHVPLCIAKFCGRLRASRF